MEQQIEVGNAILAGQSFNFENQLNEIRERKQKIEDSLTQHRSKYFDTENVLLGPLTEYMDHINGKAKTYTLSAKDVRLIASETEGILSDKGITKKNRIGTVLEYRPAGKKVFNSAASRQWTSITTRVWLRRIGDGWRLIEAVRDECYANQPEFRKIHVRPAAHDEILRNATAGFVIQCEADKA